jgi:hypothetical protein
MDKRIVKVKNEKLKYLVIVKVERKFRSFGNRPMKKKDEWILVR